MWSGLKSVKTLRKIYGTADITMVGIIIMGTNIRGLDARERGGEP